MYRGKRIAVVVPAYNEEKLIGKTISSMPSYIDNIIVIDDCSKDATYNNARSFCKELGSKLIIIRHDINLGVGAAIVTGYKRSLSENADVVAVMAGDAQMDPEHLQLLLDPIIENRADYTKGNRLFSKDAEKMPRKRRRGNSLLTLLTKISSGYWDVIDPQNGYTAASKKIMETLDLDKIHTRYGYCNDILVKLNVYNFRVMDVVMPPVYGDEKSGIKIKSYTPKMSWLLIKCFFYRIRKKYGGLRFHPLVLFFMVGFFLFMLGLIEGIIVLSYRLNGTNVSDGTMILTSLALLIGLQFLLFGLLFDMLSTRNATENNNGAASKLTKSFHPTIIGLFRRFSSKHWGSGFHPLALLYGAGTVLFLCGLILGFDVLYSRLIMGQVYTGPMLLTLLLLITGVQSVFFAMLFEMELSRK